MTTTDATDRQLITTELDTTLFVEAGAGSGKTTALIDRVVQLVATGIPMDNIAAITFTEAAATELRGRLRSELEAAHHAGRVSAESLDQLDDAAVCTLHAFAQRILTQFPIEAGLPPVFEVLDEVESAMELEARFTRFLDDMFASPEMESPLRRAMATGFRFDNLHELARIFHDHRDRLPTDPFPAPPPPVIDAAPILASIDAALAHAPDCQDDADRLLARLVGAEDSWERVRAVLVEAASQGELAVLDVLNSVALPRGGIAGRRQAWSDVAAVRDACQVARAAWEAPVRAANTQTAAFFVEEVRKFTLTFTKERVAAGRLVFHDLLVLARDVLRQSIGVRRAVADQWHRLLIDEFQDTDPLQLEIAVLLGASPANGDADQDLPWNEFTLDPGRLFFVGDAKQSIYRFRRADIELYKGVRDAFVLLSVGLTVNYRSVPGILHWVNAVFEQLLAAPGDKDGQVEHQALLAHREADGSQPAVRMLGGAAEGHVDEIRTAEAHDVVATIRAACAEGWPIARDGETRAATAADIAILIPTRAVLPHLERALTSANVPYRVESASLVWNTQVVRDLRAVLRALTRPADKIAVVGALRTSALACSDQDLLSWRQAGGRWALHAEVPDGIAPDHPVSVGLARMEQFHAATWWNPVADLVDQVAHALPFFALATVSRATRDRWRQLRFVIEQARAFAERPGATLRQFLAWADMQGSDQARVRDPALPEDDHDAVRILTVHGAKGLEFPISIIAGLNVAPRGADPAVVAWRDAGPVARLGAAFPMAGFEEARTEEQLAEALERTRLLYVAMTRARDHLVVSLHRAEGAPGSRTDAARVEAAWLAADPDEKLAERYQAPAGSEPAGANPRPDGGRHAATDDEIGRSSTAADWDDAERTWSEEREALIARMRRAPVVAATAIDGLVPPDGATATSDRVAIQPDPKGEPLPDAPRHRVGRAGTSIGRAVHAVLQTVDLRTGNGVDDIARAQASAEGVPDHAAQVARLAKAAIDSDVVREAIQHRHWRELYVAAPVGGTVIEGFVDLLYDDGEGLVIVDYKTDAVDDSSGANALAARYRSQLAAYAVALERTTGRPVRAAVLLFVAGGVARASWATDLAEATSDIERRAAALATGFATA